jgi:hypothetical protein
MGNIQSCFFCFYSETQRRIFGVPVWSFPVKADVDCMNRGIKDNSDSYVMSPR